MLKSLLILVILYGTCHGARILVFYPGSSTSLLSSFTQLFQELSRRGHQLSVVTAHELGALEKLNITQIPMGRPFSDGVLEKLSELPLIPQIYYNWEVGLTDCSMLLKSPKFIEFINSNETYDLFIGSPFYFLECSIAVAHHLKLPLLNIFSNRLPIHASHLMGHMFPSSYIAEFNLPFSHSMSFWQRSLNTVFCLGYSASLSSLYLPRMASIVKQHFPNLPPLQEMLTQVPVTLINTNLAVHPAQPKLPGVIPVSGLTIPQRVKLPKGLESWMNRSEEGVVLFSLGSHMNMTSLSPEVLLVILGVFDKIPQRVLMKWEADHLPGKPANVRLERWIPQAAVLSHPNCRMMITHGGLYSWMEAVHYSVPLLGIMPSFLDQSHNLAEMQERGHGLYFKGPWTQDNFHTAFNEVLHNPKFKEDIEKSSKIFWDQPMNPLQTAVYWTEYVIHHKGAMHLLSSASSMPWYQVALLDVVAALALLVIALTLLTQVAIRSFKRWMVDYEYIIFNGLLRVFYKLRGN